MVNDLPQRWLVQGFLAMGLFFVWILYLPFQGPGLIRLTLSTNDFIYFFYFSHVVGFFHGGWVYYQDRFRGRIRQLVEFLCLGTVVVGTLFLAIVDSAVIPGLLSGLFAIMGYCSGWLIIRWCTWFSSSMISKSRGAIWGASLGLSNIVLFFLTVLFLTNANEVRYGLLVCAALALFGGYAIIQLPLPGNEQESSLKDEAKYSYENTETGFLSSIMPPTSLLVFALFIFSLSAFPYRYIYPVHIYFSPYLSWLVLIPYLLMGLFLGRWADRNSHRYMAILAFMMIGIAFSVMLLLPYWPSLILLVEIFVLFGTVCGNFYYWISLASYGAMNRAPLIFAIGLSAEIMIFLITFLVVPYVPNSFASSQPFIGAVGFILILLGITVLFWTNYQFIRPMDELDHKPGDELPIPSTISTLSVPSLSKKTVQEILSPYYNLTAREWEVIYLIVQGHSNNQISEMLCVSTSTVKFHIGNVLKKIGGLSRVDIVKIFYEKGRQG